jgi:hypothetical protein
MIISPLRFHGLIHVATWTGRCRRMYVNFWIGLCRLGIVIDLLGRLTAAHLSASHELCRKTIVVSVRTILGLLLLSRCPLFERCWLTFCSRFARVLRSLFDALSKSSSSGGSSRGCAGCFQHSFILIPASNLSEHFHKLRCRGLVICGGSGFYFLLALSLQPFQE